ncbi:CheY chemotaxis protein or a CheY-like REC (receiver) domain [Desulfacinum infernum DSM 9756]|uniref:CheY chemotaxis protein or a CheY-like REC (Receiver) domain n=1 Tax=Desulfacinum infernum DSM 9756 TaxID=1121391 RepID=A0A1M5F668_9BACT|nr:CheY chemotaxis protein or a CheY-like REC (receiver) domain [Desulfacinum infernum DSM 9756]
MGRGNPLERNLRILITDRNRHVRAFLRRELAREGFEVSEAFDCRDMHRQLRSCPSFHALVFDPDVAYGSGLETLRFLKDHYPQLPVVVHSYCDESPELAGMADAVVAKKGPTWELKAVLRRVLLGRAESGGGQEASRGPEAEGNTLDRGPDGHER